MIHAQANESRFIHSGCSGSGVAAMFEEKPEYNNQIPEVRYDCQFLASDSTFFDVYNEGCMLSVGIARDLSNDLGSTRALDLYKSVHGRPS